MTATISWCFLFYFVILGLERLQSIIKNSTENFSPTRFNTYANLVVAVSLIVTAVLLAVACKGFWGSLFSNSVTPNYLWLSITAGVMLVAGMVHTENTVVTVQFASYGALILGMILRTVQVTKDKGNTFSWWFSLAFVIVLAMSIPVVYSTTIRNAALFYVIEAVVMLALVTSFTLLLINVMTGNGANLLWLIPTLIVLCGNTLVLALRWRESVNSFVLIFSILTVVLYAIGKLLLSNKNGIMMKP